MSEADRRRVQPVRLRHQPGAARTLRVPRSSRIAARFQRSDGLPTRSPVLRARDRPFAVEHRVDYVERRAVGHRPIHADDRLPRVRAWTSTTVERRRGDGGSTGHVPPAAGRQHGGPHAPSLPEPGRGG